MSRILKCEAKQTKFQPNPPSGRNLEIVLGEENNLKTVNLQMASWIVKSGDFQSRTNPLEVELAEVLGVVSVLEPRVELLQLVDHAIFVDQPDVVAGIGGGITGTGRGAGRGAS